VTLVDANVLIDLFINDPIWSDWSIARLRERSLRGPLFINDVVYAESSTRFPSLEDFQAALATAEVLIRATPPAALFLAGKAFKQYRRAGGIRTGVLSDFFVGAQAVVERIPLLTRDGHRYRHYFPGIALISPE